jgi:hypothetical protein
MVNVAPMHDKSTNVNVAPMDSTQPPPQINNESMRPVAPMLVPELEGPFDFVFVDADKDWYVRYLEMVLPKLEPGGCFYATPGLETEIDESGNGLSVSFLEKGTD